MIFTALFELARSIILFIFSFFEITPLSYSAVSALYDIICYGTWVVGADILHLVCDNIVFWIGVRLTVGIIAFAWDLLPFT